MGLRGWWKEIELGLGVGVGVVWYEVSELAIQSEGVAGELG